MTTFAVLLFVIRAEIRSDPHVNVFDRALGVRVQRQALSAALLGIACVVVGTWTVRRRGPQVVLVDRLAHPGRGEAVIRLLQAGIDVVSTVDVTEIESLRDTVEAITDRPPSQTLPDAVLGDGTEVHLVDATAQQMAQRIAMGDVVAPPGRWVTDPRSLGALRQVALLWLAERVDVGALPVEAGRVCDGPAPSPPVLMDLDDRSAGPRQRTAESPSGWRLAAGWGVRCWLLRC